MGVVLGRRIIFTRSWGQERSEPDTLNIRRPWRGEQAQRLLGGGLKLWEVTAMGLSVGGWIGGAELP